MARRPPVQASRRPSPIVGIEYKQPRYPLGVPVEVLFPDCEDHIPGIVHRYAGCIYHFHFTHPVTHKKTCRELDNTCKVRIDGKEWRIYKTSILVNDDWMANED
jgi:hypothetical protein